MIIKYFHLGSYRYMYFFILLQFYCIINQDIIIAYFHHFLHLDFNENS